MLAVSYTNKTWSIVWNALDRSNDATIVRMSGNLISAVAVLQE